MKREYDFSGAERGKFFRPELELVPPIHLDPNVRSWLSTHAESKGKTLNELINELLKKDIELIEAAK
jgi:predicted HicB family RNase H-like nuclease